ncbi:hypothetical protein QBC37DRAFT_428487 [Rhypophila decipiens]|uniref:FAD-binding PCMH-type domain-containing protein n=1 Tax=Rhypophila decipiens TaxID=261697 RepID=A0AAN6Y3J1_9PEZI|nr:hypothetical protein QBC37DRAFT_428487 [Rhypophila decipiens]
MQHGQQMLARIAPQSFTQTRKFELPLQAHVLAYLPSFTFCWLLFNPTSFTPLTFNLWTCRTNFKLPLSRVSTPPLVQDSSHAPDSTELPLTDVAFLSPFTDHLNNFDTTTRLTTIRMASLETLKKALREDAETVPSSARLPLTDEQYSAGFKIFKDGRAKSYHEFIIPQLSTLMETLINARSRISVLEIGPGPESVLGLLPEKQRRLIRSYTAIEPNKLFASRLESCLLEDESLLPGLDRPPTVRPRSFRARAGPEALGHDKFDLILFCHSMYGMEPKRDYIERALGMLLDNDEQLPGDGLVVVFHQEGIHFNGLVCHRTALFPTGTVSISNECAKVDSFVKFVSGCTVEGQGDVVKVTAEGNRALLCRSLDRSEGDRLIVSAPEVMIAFTRHAASLPELISQMRSLFTKPRRRVKNTEARLCSPAALMVPTEISHIQACVRWANQHRAQLTVIGGSHSGHCIVPNVVAIDMCSFNNVHVAPTAAGVSLIIAEAGANAGDIINKGMTEGLTVPLGSRPSVGAGLWLQGGIGHLARMYGLTCDSVVGAVLVSADSGDIVHVGSVPSRFQPAGSSRPRADLERDILWAIKGAGTNFGVVVSVVFRSCPVSTFLVRSWKFPLFNDAEARHRVRRFDKEIAGKLPRKCSSDAYLYHDADTDKLHLGVTIYQVSAIVDGSEDPLPLNTQLSPAHETQLSNQYSLETQFSSRIKGVLGPAAETRVVDCNGLFETDMYMSGMQGGHGGGKTSSFKRCVFLKAIGSADTTLQAMVDAMNMRPTALCYLHLLHGGGSEGVVHNVRSDATAFGCRDWDFACVVTGVWLRDQDSSDEPRQVQQWVYDVVTSLLTLDSCSGVYPADLGPDPRDTSLALKAFGPNRPCLAHLKKALDPHNTMAYACPLPKEPKAPELIILVTGQHGAGKDYCADLWTSFFQTDQKSLATRSVSISTAIKREYAEASGANLKRLLTEREYKEEHRPALTAFWEKRVGERQNLAEETFINCVYNAAVDDVDVLLITGMRDEAPVAKVSHLVPNSRVVEVHVRADNETMRQRRSMMPPASSDDSFDAAPKTLNYIPDFIFDNNASGDINVKNFAARYLVPYSGERDDLRRLESMIRCVPNFPRQGVDFRHVLGISQQPGGIQLVTALLKTQFGGNWADIDAIVSCESGGFIFASALAGHGVDVPLVMIRKAGKLPPPVVSVAKGQSNISHASSESTGSGSSGVESSYSKDSGDEEEERVEIERHAIRDPGGASVLVVDDVLASGRTLCAVLSLLREVGVEAERISVMVVAEFPVHRGRKALREAGFGQVRVQSLLVFGGV